MIYVENLGIETTLHQSAHRYSATSAPLMSTLLHTFPGRYQDYTFIDLGSGKGRMLLVASDFEFKSVIGVELSSILHETATHNIRQYKSNRPKHRPVISVNQNAVDFVFPASNIALFLFNPFPSKVLLETLENLLETATKSQSNIIVYYSNPVSKEIFESSTDFSEIELPQFFKYNWKNRN